MLFLGVLAIFVVAIICCNGSVHDTDNPVHVAFKEIMDLVPQDQIKRIAEEHLRSDEEFRAAIAYMKSNNWTEKINTLHVTTEWLQFINYLEEIFGYEVEHFLEGFLKFLVNATVTVDPRNTAGNALNSFMEDVEMAIPINKMLKIFYKKIVNTGIYKETLEKMRSEKFKEILSNLLSVSEVKEILDKLDNMGLVVRNLFPNS